MALLTLENVSKSFQTARRPRKVLAGINMRVEEGEFVCVVGCSGAGKTTLISLIAGLLKPDEGRCLFDGKPITGPSTERGIVFQNYSLLPWMTAFENVHLAVEAVSPQATSEEKRARTDHLIQMVNLGHAKEKRPQQLSGGMRQRVSVARGLAMNPRLLLLDEPFSALDALTRATLQEELSRIWMSEKKTVVMITNDMEEAILLSDRIYLLTPGPEAVLGANVPVLLERPRVKHALNMDTQYRAIRHTIVEFFTEHRTPKLAGAAS